MNIMNNVPPSLGGVTWKVYKEKRNVRLIANSTEVFVFNEVEDLNKCAIFMKPELWTSSRAINKSPLSYTLDATAKSITIQLGMGSGGMTAQNIEVTVIEFIGNVKVTNFQHVVVLQKSLLISGDYTKALLLSSYQSTRAWDSTGNISQSAIAEDYYLEVTTSGITGTFYYNRDGGYPRLFLSIVEFL